MKRFYRLTLCAVLCLGALSGTVHAESSLNHETEVTLEFQENNSITPPVDPDNPGNPGGGGGTGMEGPLSLDYAPTLAFQPIISSEETTTETSELKPYVQITDNRGTGRGWKLSAKLSGFTTSETVEGQTRADVPSLQGAEINLKDAVAVSANTGLDKPFALQTVRLISGAASDVPVIIGGAEGYGAGTGTWVNRWYPTYAGSETTNPNVELTVYAETATPGTHNATITWTLADAP